MSRRSKEKVPAVRSDAPGSWIGERPGAAASHGPESARRPAGLSDRWTVFGVCLFLAAAIWVVFGQTLHYAFVNFDDDDYVYDNLEVARGLTLPGIVWAFTHVYAANWHPLTWISHMLDCQLYGLHAGGHHLTNILLHMATAILLFLVLSWMTGFLWRSAFVAAVFALLPFRVESVAWVAERKDVLSGVFFMLTLWAYVRYARRPWSVARYGWVVLAFGLGLMCKPMLVTLPFVLWLLDYWPLNRVAAGAGRGHPLPISRRLILEKLPLFGMAAAACVATLFAQTVTLASVAQISLPMRVGNALISYVTYLGQMFWPSGLAVLYPFTVRSVGGSAVVLSLAVLAGVSAGVFVLGRGRPYFLTGWLWYLVMLVPVIGIVQVGDQTRADRYTYLPQIGLYILVTWAAADWCAGWRHRRVVLGGLATVVLVALTWCAHTQTSYWRDSESLWTHTLACTSGNFIGQNNLGNALLQNGDVDDAITHFQEALQINPGYVEAHINLGNALFQRGKVDEAIAQYQRALQINPDYAGAHYDLGNALLRQGSVDEAIAQYQRALQIRPDYALAHGNLGNALLQKGNVDEAVAHIQRALQIKPGNATAHNNLGNALLRKGSVGEAIVNFRKALRINPDYAEAHYNLGNALVKEGDADEAITHFQKALQINPDYAEAHYNLGNALLQKGRVDEAIAQYQKALQIKPDYAEVHNNLGNALLQRGGVDEAIAQYQKALQIKPEYLEAHNNLGFALLQKGSVDEAITHFQKALQINPDYAEAQKNLAWVLATCPQASLRNGNKAVELAERANQLTKGVNPVVLVTLAAAYAEAGRFPEAVATAQRALQLAETHSAPALAEAIHSQLKLYQAGIPYHLR